MQHPYRELVGRVYVAFRFSFLAFIVIMVIGTIGYWHISGGKATLLDCAYMTFITIATIGYGEEIAVPPSAAERRIAELAPADSDYVLLAVRRDGRWQFNPTPESTAKPGETLVVMATPAGRSKLERRVAA